MPILRSIQYVTYKYGDFQKASRITLHEPCITFSSHNMFSLCCNFPTVPVCHNLVKRQGKLHFQGSYWIIFLSWHKPHCQDPRKLFHVFLLMECNKVGKCFPVKFHFDRKKFSQKYYFNKTFLRCVSILLPLMSVRPAVYNNFPNGGMLHFQALNSGALQGYCCILIDK